MKSFYLLMSIAYLSFIIMYGLLIPVAKRNFSSQFFSIKLIKQWSSSGERSAKVALIFMYLGVFFIVSAFASFLFL